MGQKIFFLETDIFSLGNGLVIQPTICGTSVWDISLKPIIRKCFVSSSCSIDWFEKRDLPDSSHGGVKLTACSNKIVCDNTMGSRLDLVYSELMPSIREILFPEQ